MSYNEYTLGNLFNDLFEDSYVRNKIPPVDVYENEGSYFIVAEVPCYEKEDIKLTLEKHVLTIAAKKKECQDERKYLMREIKHNGFSRSFTLPEDADESGISANLENGVLTLQIAKKVKKDIGSINIKIN